MTNFEKVELFMRTFGQDIKNKSSLSTDNINKLRISLIEEELNEFKSKLGNDGKPIYNEHGKVMKGPKYFKPDLSKFLT